MAFATKALGLPASNQPFAHGSFCQHSEVPGVWLERARRAAGDTLLMNRVRGAWRGSAAWHRFFFVAGSTLKRHRRQEALNVALQVIEVHPLCAGAGVTSPCGQVMVIKVLAPLVEPAVTLLKQVWQVWRGYFRQLAASTPCIWST